jgi:hypothetical protein
MTFCRDASFQMPMEAAAVPLWMKLVEMMNHHLDCLCVWIVFVAASDS